MNDDGTTLTNEEHTKFCFDKNVFLTANGMFVSGDSMAANEKLFEAEHERICKRLAEEAKAGDELSAKAIAEAIRRRLNPI